MPYRRLLPAGLAALVWLVQATSAQAAPVRVDLEARFYPPNPCADPGALGVLGDYRLQGVFALYAQDTRSADPVLLNREVLAVGGIACGAGAGTGFGFDWDLAQDASLFLSFAGFLLPDPGPPELPVFAFDVPLLPNPGPPDLPAAAPLIAIGGFSAGVFLPDPGPPDLPLYAFASPGQAIGSVTASVQVVPEPASAALLGLALAGWAAVRRRPAARPR